MRASVGHIYVGAKCRLYMVVWTKSLFGLYIFESMDDGKVERQGQDRGGGNSMVYGGKARALVIPTITTPSPLFT